MRSRLAKLKPQAEFLAVIRAELPEDGIVVDEVTQIGFASRLLFPVYKPRTFLSPGYQDNLGWGFATALGAQHARRDVPVLSISGDGGFLFTSNELATAMRHRIALTTVVFNDGAFGNVRRIQEEQYGNRLIASDLTNPDFVKYAQSFGAEAERARNPNELRLALNRAFKRRDVPTLIESARGLDAPRPGSSSRCRRCADCDEMIYEAKQAGTGAPMTKKLDETLIAKVREPPETDQDLAADLLLWYWLNSYAA